MVTRVHTLPVEHGAIITGTRERTRRDRADGSRGRADHQLQALMSCKHVIFSGNSACPWAMMGEIVPVHH